MVTKSSIKSVLVIGCVVVLAVMAGCAKKTSQGAADKNAAAAAPQLKQDSAKAESNTDIFDEFYKEEGSSSKTAVKTAKVEPKTAPTKTSAISASLGEYAFSENGRYTVQISCVVSATLADRLVKKLKGSGYPAYSAEVQSPTPSLSGTFYRVRIGGFAGLSMAKSFAEGVLVPAGYEYWIDSKSNDNVGAEGYGLGSSSGGAASSYTPSTYSAPASTYESQPAVAAPESAPESAPVTATETAPASVTSGSGSSSEPAAAESSSSPAAKTTETAPVPSSTPASSTPASNSDGWGTSDSSAW